MKSLLRIHLILPALLASLMSRIGVKTLLKSLGNLRKTMAVLISPDTGLKSEIAIVGHGTLLAPLVVVNLGTY